MLAKTDVQVRVPRGTYGRVAPRSGLAWKHHIDIGAGVVDEDYRGNLGRQPCSELPNVAFFFCSVEADLSFPPGVVMFNHAEAEFTVKAGDRIAQLVCERIAQPEIQVHWCRGQFGPFMVV